MNRFTFGGPNRTPVWSPDGKRIAYSYNPSDGASVIIKRADGTGTDEKIPMDHRTYVNCWSHDGSTLLLSIPIAESGWDLYTLALNGDRKVHPWLATKFDEFQASLSLDDKWVSFFYRERGTGEIYVKPFPNGEGKWQVSTGGGREAHWAPDGKTLYFTGSQTITAVPIMNDRSFVMGQSRVIIGDYPWVPLESAATFDVSPDGRHILITRSKEGTSAPRQINVVMNWFDELKKNAVSGK